MDRVIKNFSKLARSQREEVYTAYHDNESERTTFPYKGAIVDGVIFRTDDVIYLVPISSIVAGRAGSAGDLDDNDDAEEVESVREEEALNA